LKTPLTLPTAIAAEKMRGTDKVTGLMFSYVVREENRASRHQN
jgi:hypothetical protein